jgi:hypothetical protein
VVDFIVRHRARAEVVEAREDHGANQQDNQQFFNARAGHQGTTGLSSHRSAGLDEVAASVSAVIKGSPF